MRYEMTVTQTISKDIPVIADNEQEAYDKANQILINDDFNYMTDNDIEIDTNIEIKNEEKSFTFAVEEILTKLTTVVAENEEKAKEKVKNLYDDENIILDYNDHSGTTFKLL